MVFYTIIMGIIDDDWTESKEDMRSTLGLLTYRVVTS